MRVSNVASKTGFADVLWQTLLLLYTYIPLQMSLTYDAKGEKKPSSSKTSNYKKCFVIQLPITSKLVNQPVYLIG